MTQPFTCQGWLEVLDQLDPTEEDWSDPFFVERVSWIMYMFLWRRINQKMIDAGAAIDSRPEYR